MWLRELNGVTSARDTAFDAGKKGGGVYWNQKWFDQNLKVRLGEFEGGFRVNERFEGLERGRDEGEGCDIDQSKSNFSSSEGRESLVIRTRVIE